MANLDCDEEPHHVLEEVGAPPPEMMRSINPCLKNDTWRRSIADAGQATTPHFYVCIEYWHPVQATVGSYSCHGDMPTCTGYVYNYYLLYIVVYPFYLL